MKNVVLKGCTVGIAMCTAAALGAAQNPQKTDFEVASVRLSSGPAIPGSQRISDSRIDITGVPLRNVLLLAFRVAEHQIVGPNWLDDVRVDISATLPAGTTRQEVPGMLQRLLVTRFGLTTHREMRSLDTFALVVGAGGMKMNEVQPIDQLEKTFPSSAIIDELTDTPDGPVRTVLAGLALTTLTKRTMYQVAPTNRGTQLLDATRMTMPELAALLEINVDMPVIDRTGLLGIYQFRIELPPHARAARWTGLRPAAGAAPSGASASRAVESIGLKLERQRAPVDVLVIDKIVRAPTEN